MTHGYQWETEDGTGTAVVSDAPIHAFSVHDILKLAQQVAEMDHRLSMQEDGVANICNELSGHTERLNRIQDANLAPMLESSAVIVQLTRIADALEALTKSIDGVQEANVYGQWCVRTMPFGGDS